MLIKIRSHLLIYCYYHCYCLAASHRFSADEIDWGFTRFYETKFMNRTLLQTGKGPFIVNNQAVITVFVRIVKDETGVLWHNLTK